MFTGIIKQLGEIAAINLNGLTVKTTRAFIGKLAKGDSVSVNGVCLTVAELGENNFGADVMPETRQRTNLKWAKVGDPVNLELPATAATFLSGNIVYGHVDGVIELKSIKRGGNSQIFRFSLPKNLAKYPVEKGSVAINGISLTVIESGKNYFTVGIIPYTLKNTMLQSVKIGEFFNIEVDILAKYIWQKI